MVALFFKTMVFIPAKNLYGRNICIDICFFISAWVCKFYKTHLFHQTQKHVEVFGIDDQKSKQEKRRSKLSFFFSPFYPVGGSREEGVTCTCDDEAGQRKSKEEH